MTADAMRVYMQFGDQLRNRIIIKARSVGASVSSHIMNRILLENYLAQHGAPWNRQPWHFKGPTLAEMFAGPRIKRIPRELRRIYAPFP